jgi:hypothetical protein
MTEQGAGKLCMRLPIFNWASGIDTAIYVSCIASWGLAGHAGDTSSCLCAQLGRGKPWRIDPCWPLGAD